jgi:hypothetical protein
MVIRLFILKRRNSMEWGYNIYFGDQAVSANPEETALLLHLIALSISYETYPEFYKWGESIVAPTLDRKEYVLLYSTRHMLLHTSGERFSIKEVLKEWSPTTLLTHEEEG